MRLQESGEMYLETIFVLSKTKPQVRAIDIAEHLHYSKPSVSRAVGILKNGGFISVDDSGFITLTTSGKNVAKKIYERHTVISSFLTLIGVNPETAKDDACKIEHVISDDTFKALKNHLNQNK
ncbi:MAG: metal-dependent transcriptional regulator [Clostridia bacterium]|nr:metal-dependent transcriptional regulator [Clostridia bacterium]